jgi:hypothetical protein
MILQLSQPQPELWESWKRHRHFQSGRSPRLFHSSCPGQILQASGSSNCYGVVVRCSRDAKKQSSAWRQIGCETKLLVNILPAVDHGSSPRLLMPINRVLPPLEFCRGTRPSSAASCRQFAKARPLLMAATMAVAVSGPIRSTAPMRLQSS